MHIINLRIKNTTYLFDQNLVEVVYLVKQSNFPFITDFFDFNERK